MAQTRDVEEVLAAYGLQEACLVPIPHGHIHETLKVQTARGTYVLQRLSPLFGPEVHEDIEAVTTHLERAGVLTPRLVRSLNEKLCVRDPNGHTWRLLTYVEGQTCLRATSSAQCESAGALVGRFHATLEDLCHAFRHTRLGVHDTPRHLANLTAALKRHPRHPARAEVEKLAGAIVTALEALPRMPDCPARIAHGDLKLSNILFSPAGEALCLLDLDTLGRMPRPVELGDALRSWCNREGEDAERPLFDLELFVASLKGYLSAAGHLLGADEAAALPLATETIALELAARFAADTLEESYFAWDKQSYAAAWMHNLRRTRASLALARSVASQRLHMHAAVAAIIENAAV